VSGVYSGGIFAIDENPLLQAVGGLVPEIIGLSITDTRSLTVCFKNSGNLFKKDDLELGAYETAMPLLTSNLFLAILISSSQLVLGHPWNGKKSNFHGFEQTDFKLDGLNCKIVVPKKAAPGNPWIWRARFWGHEPQTDIALLKKGFHVAYCDVSGLYGAPSAVERWDRFYNHVTKEHQFSKKAALEGMSRGGLIIFNWAIKNPEKVSCIYADAPVCDFKSWPKINKAITAAYKLTTEDAKNYQGNPVDSLAPLAKAGVPLLHVVGDDDKVVPVSENTAVIEKRYLALKGPIKVIHKPGVGHHPHSLKNPKPIVDFILTHTK